MTATLLDGKAVAKSIRDELDARVTNVVERLGRPPALAIVLVGDDPASEVYVRNKLKTAEDAGMDVHLERLPGSSSLSAVLAVVDRFNKDPKYDGILVPHRPELAGELLPAVAFGRAALQRRTMVEAVLDDGQTLRALNEVFVGHRTHQSARYLLRAGGKQERQSSSGLICATGTGATGWARSIATQRNLREGLPAPAAEALAWFVREPFPSVSSGTRLDHGALGASDALEIVSEMGEGGTVFADGIEADPMEFPGPTKVVVSVAKERLELVVGAG